MSKILKFYRYIYYWLFVNAKKSGKQESSIIILSLLIFINIFSVAAVLLKFINPQHYNNIPRTYILTVLVILYLFNFFLFLYKGKSRFVYNEFKGEDIKT